MFIDFSERSERKKKKLMWGRNINWFPPVQTLTKNRTHNLGMCLDRELNLQPFGVPDDSPANWATHSGQYGLALEVEFYDILTLAWLIVAVSMLQWQTLSAYIMKNVTELSLESLDNMPGIKYYI